MWSMTFRMGSKKCMLNAEALVYDLLGCGVSQYKEHWIGCQKTWIMIMALPWASCEMRGVWGKHFFLSGSQMLSCIKWKIELEIYRHEYRFMSQHIRISVYYEIHHNLGFILDQQDLNINSRAQSNLLWGIAPGFSTMGFSDQFLLNLRILQI